MVKTGSKHGKPWSKQSQEHGHNTVNQGQNKIRTR